MSASDYSVNLTVENSDEIDKVLNEIVRLNDIIPFISQTSENYKTIIKTHLRYLFNAGRRSFFDDQHDQKMKKIEDSIDASLEQISRHSERARELLKIIK